MTSRKKWSVVVAQDAGLGTVVLCCLSLVGCAATYTRVGFLWEHGHQSSVAQKPIPFCGIGSVTDSTLLWDDDVLGAIARALPVDHPRAVSLSP
jgi:hypothetical protein